MQEPSEGEADWLDANRAAEPQVLSDLPFRLFIESVQDYAIFMLDPGGRVLTWNKGAERMKGYSADEILGEHFSIFYTPSDRARRHPTENLARARRKGRMEEEGWRIRRDGGRFWANVVITAIRDESGELIGYGKVTRDLTERKRQEERERELRREQLARKEAEAASRAKSEFLAAMSHELRTPLNAILGYVDLMEQEIQGPLTGDQRRSVERIRKSGKHLLRLVNDVLNFTRVQAGRVTYEIREVAVNEIFEDLKPLVVPQMSRKSIDFEILPCTEGSTVRADATKVGQILLNLLTNALKFTPEGGEVVVECVADDESARIRVRDTGSGIDPGRQETIFEPFVQVDRDLHEDSQKGVGLGLAISRDVARAMDGDLTVESEVGRGSTFTLELPRAQ